MKAHSKSLRSRSTVLIYPGAYLRSVARNVIIIAFRRRMRPTVSLDDIDPEELHDQSAGPEDNVASIQRSERVDFVLGTLTGRGSQAVQLVAYEGLSYEQAAQRLRRATSTVESNYRRAINFLRTRIPRDL